MAEFFIELFSEEMPSSLQISARKELLQIIINYLDSEQINYEKNYFAFSTPNRSANALYAPSILNTSVVPRGTSSTQKSDSGFNSIDPANNAIWKGLRFSVLVANGCDKNSTSV